MRVIARLLETALVLTYIFGMWAATRRRRRARHRGAQRRLLEQHGPRRDTVASGYIGATGWDGYIVPPAPDSAPVRPGKRARRSHAGNDEVQRQARRRLARASRPRPGR